MGNNLQSASGGRPQNRSVGSYHASGPGKLIAVLYGVFTLSAGARAGYQLVRKFDEAPLAILLSLLSAVIYAVAAVALARRGERARRVALVTISAELVGVLGVGALSLVAPHLFPLASVWSHFGQGYGFIPLVLPVVGLWWLFHSRRA
jgi:integral membrane protein